jgi:hypothetical protein
VIRKVRVKFAFLVFVKFLLPSAKAAMLKFCYLGIVYVFVHF